MLWAIVAILILIIIYEKTKKHPDQDLLQSIGSLKETINNKDKDIEYWKKEAVELCNSLDTEKENNAKILSQKKSSETRLGAISENLIPLLSGLPYDPKNLHHLGQPLDYIYFDYENAELIFIEVKSGNAKESNRQKLLKRAIMMGKVYYEKITINEKGIKVKRETNVD